MMRRPILFVACLSLSGCAGLGRKSDEPLIGNLEYQPAVIEKRPIQEVDRQAVMENYRRLLTLEPDPQLNSEATRRLADLQLDNRETQLLEQTEAAPIKAEDLKSIELYEGLLARDPNYANRDQVLYQLSRAYELAGDQVRMMQVLDQLVEQHPQSPHWTESQFRRGERLFVEQRYAEAEAAYDAILERQQDSPFFDRALFKHGWARFKQQRIEAGLDSFTLLLDRKLNHLPVMEAERLSAADQELLKETLRVMSLTFSELGGPERITRYFQQHGHRAYEFMVYRGLGDLYERQQRIKDSADAYLAFVELDPTHAQAPRLAVKVIGLYEQHKFPLLALESKKTFTSHYRSQGENWEKFEESDQIWIKDRLRIYLKQLAEYHHALLQDYDKQKTRSQKKRAELGEQAVFWYRRYLESFPAEAASGNMSFLLGELLVDLQRFSEAVIVYERSAYLYPPHAKSSEAGYAALLAYSEEAKRKTGDLQKAWIEDGIGSALRFAAAFPADPRTPAVLTQAAERLFSLHDLAQAREVALRVTTLQPPAKTELRRTAWLVAAHAAFDLEDYAAAETSYLQALNFTPLKDPSRQDLEERLAASIYQQGMILRTIGDQGGAARQFMRVGKLVPQASIRATAEFDAAASLLAIEEWNKAIGVLEAFRQRFPKSPLLGEINTKLAVAYVKTDQPLKAAREFTTLSSQGETPAIRREAGWQAAELFDKAGSSKQAIQAYEAYVRQFPSPLEPAVEARQRLAELYHEAGNRRQQQHWLRELIGADVNGGKQRSDRTRFLAAHANLRLAQPAHEVFRHIELKAPLKQNLQRKKQQMQSAIDYYEKAAAYGVSDVTTAATYHIGELYQQFGAALLESERPKGLNAEELEQYEILLEEQAFPFEDKAIALHETNAGRTTEGIYDEWVKKSFSALATLLPARYAKQEFAEEVSDAIN